MLEIVIAAALIALAWEKPWHQQVGAVIPALAPKPAAPVAATYHRPVAIPDSPPPNARGAEAPRPQIASSNAAPAKRNNDWMFDPKRPGSLDRPGATPVPSFTNHIYYKDDEGKKYWLDGQGMRHYD